MTTVNPTAVGRRVSLPAAVAWFAFAASLAFLVVPIPEGVSPTTMRAAGAVVLAIGLLSTGALPEYLTGGRRSG